MDGGVDSQTLQLSTSVVFIDGGHVLSEIVMDETASDSNTSVYGKVSVAGQVINVRCGAVPDESGQTGCDLRHTLLSTQLSIGVKDSDHKFRKAGSMDLCRLLVLVCHRSLVPQIGLGVPSYRISRVWTE